MYLTTATEKRTASSGSSRFTLCAGDGAAPVTTTTIEDQVKNLQTRVAAIEKYLQAAGGSGNSRKQYHGVNGVFYNADYGW